MMYLQGQKEIEQIDELQRKNYDLEADLETAHATLADFTRMARELTFERDSLQLVQCILTRNQIGKESTDSETGSRMVQTSNSRRPMEAGQF